LVYTGERDVYSSYDTDEIETKLFGTYYGGAEGTPHLLQETVAVFPTADLAFAFINEIHEQ
jgi:hypothetical protein